MPLFRLLRHGKALRGTAWDPFGVQAERCAERALVDQYVADLRAALAVLSPATIDAALGLANLPDLIRGFGPVKDANRIKADTARIGFLARLSAPPRVALAAE